MRINTKKLTDEYGDVWIMLYEDMGVNEPLSMLRDFDAESLATQITLALDLKAQPLDASEIQKKNDQAEA